QDLADEAGALRVRLWMGEDDLDAVQRAVRPGDQAVPNRQVVLADEGEPVRVERQRVEGGRDRALDRVLERDQSAVGLAPADGEDRVVDRGGRDALDLVAPHGRPQGVLVEGAPGAQIGNPHYPPT